MTDDYQQAREIARLFTDRLGSALNDGLVGLYLVGSLPLGDFQPDSDIDFVAVLRDVGDVVADAIVGTHNWITKEAPERKLEGFYIDAGDLTRHPRDATGGLHFLEGDLKPMDPDRLIEWEMLRRFGERICGPAVEELRVFDASADVAEYSRKNLSDYWQRWIDRTGPYLMARRAPRERSAWAAGWCVLGVPRLYFAIADGEIISKSEAGIRARTRFDDAWHPVIDAAIKHRRENNKASTKALSKLAADALSFSSHVLEAGLRLL